VPSAKACGWHLLGHPAREDHTRHKRRSLHEKHANIPSCSCDLGGRRCDIIRARRRRWRRWRRCRWRRRYRHRRGFCDLARSVGQQRCGRIHVPARLRRRVERDEFPEQHVRFGFGREHGIGLGREHGLELGLGHFWVGRRRHLGERKHRWLHDRLGRQFGIFHRLLSSMSDGRSEPPAVTSGNWIRIAVRGASGSCAAMLHG